MLVCHLQVKATHIAGQALDGLDVDCGSSWQHDHVVCRQGCPGMLQGWDQAGCEQSCALYRAIIQLFSSLFVWSSWS